MSNRVKKEILVDTKQLRITRFTIVPSTTAEAELRGEIEKYVAPMSGYTVYKQDGNPYAALVVEESNV